MNNETLNIFYPNLITLFDLLQSQLVNVQLLLEDDENKYKDLLITSIINANTANNFPQIIQESDCWVSFNTVSALKYNLILFL